MSTPKLPTNVQVDGMSFLGGGVRCATIQYAPMVLAMYRLKFIPEDLFYKIKYISGNSGASFTMASLLCYPLMKKAWPLQTIKDMQPSKKAQLPDQVLDFYKTYWIEPTKQKFDLIPDIEDTPVFQGVEKAEIGTYSWLNGMSELAMVPFAKYIKGTLFKDIPMATDLNMVVSFGATTVLQSNIRTKTGDVADQSVYLSSVGYKWTQPYTFTPDSSMVGVPINLIYGFKNRIIDPSVTFFNGDMADITYTQSSTPASKCTLPFTSSDSSNSTTQDPDPITVNKPFNVPLATSSLGESKFMTLVAASSAYTGCVPPINPDTAGVSECELNFVNYDQAVVFDMKKGQLLANTADEITTLPQNPLKDNGTLDLTKTPNPVYLNLCDGTNSYDNTGLLPMIRAIQMYETTKTIQSKTFNLVYFDGPDGDSIAHNPDIPSIEHFAKLFQCPTCKPSDDPRSPLDLSRFGINIFKTGIKEYKFQLESSHVTDSTGNEIWVKIYYYEGLKTIQNDYCGIKPNIKINLTVFCAYTQLDTKYNTYAELDQHSETNKILCQLWDEMDQKYHWIDSFFRAPPNVSNYSCNTKTNQCEKGKGSMTLNACAKQCTSPSSNSSSASFTFTPWEILLIVFVCIAVISCVLTKRNPAQSTQSTRVQKRKLT